MAKIIGISGSLRRASYNTALLRAAIELAPPELTVAHAPIAAIPLYDADVETEQGVPASVAALKDAIAASDGLLLVSPEYNQSVPGVLKNTIDWLSRPASDLARVFADKPVALIGATPGLGGTRMSQTAWLPIFRALGVRPWFGKQLYVAGAEKVFDAEQRLVDEKLRKLLGDFMAGFAKFVRAGGAG